MSSLMAIAYPDALTAEEVRKELALASREELVERHDAVVVERTADGEVSLRQAYSSTASARSAERRGAASLASCSSPRSLALPSERQPAHSSGRRATSASTTTSCSSSAPSSRRAGRR